MSKAFTKESDDGPEDDVDEEAAPAVPQGKRNYITVDGAARMKAELKDLLYKKRPELTQVINWAASNGDRSENADYIYGKRRLREIDRRIRFLTKRIESFDIVDPTSIKSKEVLFGATVTVTDENGDDKTYAIVGIDETNVAAGHISWISPLGSALLKKKEGDLVTFKTPKGERELEVVKVRYVAVTAS
jgi:transcription elongation factor GreB